MALELATMDILRNIAVQKRGDIRWVVENGSLRRLQDAEAKYGESTNPEERSLLNSIRQEQRNWQALYGPDGKLGFDQAGNKGILIIQRGRDLTPRDSEAIDTAEMYSREEEVLDPDTFRQAHGGCLDLEGRKVLAPGIANEVVGNQGEIRSRKLREYQDIILPQINSILTTKGKGKEAQALS